MVAFSILFLEFEKIFIGIAVTFVSSSVLYFLFHIF